MMTVYKDFLAETELLSHCNHKNVGRMIEAYRNEEGELIIIMEYYKEGNLYDKMVDD